MRIIQSMKSHTQTIFVGMSGGVDSSLSAALLKEEGYNIVGVFIKTWQPEWIECTWRQERRDAMRVCAHLDIPFVELDLEREYKQGVADYMIDEYKKGRTPNPDVMCNKEVKFGGFLSWARKHGADAVATGHYAQCIQVGDTYQLHKGNDPRKDQSYFLWTLTQEQLSSIVFPIGHLPKDTVRAMASSYNLPTATKKDSQGICFIGQVDMKDFLKHYIPEKRGDVLLRDGTIIGHHNGALFFTRGERHGFTITHKGSDDAPYYVVDKDIDANTITVDHSPQDDMLSFPEGRLVMQLHSVVWRSTSSEGVYDGQIRYHGDFAEYTIDAYDEKSGTITCSTSSVDEVPALGQSLVLYRGSECVGGGIIDAVGA